VQNTLKHLFATNLYPWSSLVILFNDQSILYRRISAIKILQLNWLQNSLRNQQTANQNIYILLLGTQHAIWSKLKYQTRSEIKCQFTFTTGSVILRSINLYITKSQFFCSGAHQLVPNGAAWPKPVSLSTLRPRRARPTDRPTNQHTAAWLRRSRSEWQWRKCRCNYNPHARSAGSDFISRARVCDLDRFAPNSLGAVILPQRTHTAASLHQIRN